MPILFLMANGVLCPHCDVTIDGDLNECLICGWVPEAATVPTTTVSDEEESFFERRYEPLWSAAAEAGMPISLHTLAGSRASREIAGYGRSVESTFFFGFTTLLAVYMVRGILNQTTYNFLDKAS